MLTIPQDANECSWLLKFEKHRRNTIESFSNKLSPVFCRILWKLKSIIIQGRIQTKHTFHAVVAGLLGGVEAGGAPSNSTWINFSSSSLLSSLNDIRLLNPDVDSLAASAEQLCGDMEGPEWDISSVEYPFMCLWSFFGDSLLGRLSVLLSSSSNDLTRFLDPISPFTGLPESVLFNGDLVVSDVVAMASDL